MFDFSEIKNIVELDLLYGVEKKIKNLKKKHA